MMNSYSMSDSNSASSIDNRSNRNTNERNNRNVIPRTNSVSRNINGRTYTISGNESISTFRPMNGPSYYYDMPDGTRYYGSSPFSISINSN